MAPRVSVVMPARDAADTIGAAVRTTLLQSLPDLELIVVDDGSVDGTAQAARAAADGDPRLRLERRPRLGVVQAANCGISLARAPLIARMDADDLMHPDRLGEQHRALESDPALGVVTCRVQPDPPGGGMQRYVDWLNAMQTHEDIVREMFVESPICNPASCVRASVLRQAGGYRDVDWAEDYDLWLRLHAAGVRFGVVPRTLLVWRDGPDRLTRTHPRYAPEAFFRAKAHFLAPLLSGRACIWGAGRDGRRLARALVDEGVRIEAFADVDPRKIGGVRRGDVPIVAPEHLPRDVPLVSAVGRPDARARIRLAAADLGFREGRDFFCAA